MKVVRKSEKSKTKALDNARRVLIIAICTITVCVMAIVCFGAHNANAAATYQSVSIKETDLSNGDAFTNKSALGAFQELYVDNISLVGKDANDNGSWHLAKRLNGDQTPKTCVFVYHEDPVDNYGTKFAGGNSYTEVYDSFTLKLAKAARDGKGNYVDIYLTVDTSALQASSSLWSDISNKNLKYAPISFTYGKDSEGREKVRTFFASSYCYVDTGSQFLVYEGSGETRKVNNTDVKDGFISNVSLNCKIEIKKAGTNEDYSSKSPVLWEFADLDTYTRYYTKTGNNITYYKGNKEEPAYTSSNFFTEAVGFKNGVNNAYIDKTNVLNTKNAGIFSCGGVSDTNGDTVIAESNASGFEFDWWGSSCATIILASKNYWSGIQLQKSSSDPTFTQSLKGAIYGIYEDSGCKTQVATMTTDEQGKAASADIMTLEQKQYWVKEISAPAAYALDTKIYEVDLSDYKSKWYSLDVSETPKQYTISTSVINGSIDPNITVKHGTNATINYAAKTGYHLVSISVDNSAVDIAQHPSSYTFSNVQAKHSIKVVYELDTTSVSTSAENGSIDKSFIAEYGSSKTINYAPNEGYHLVSVTVDGQSVDIKQYPSSYTFTNIKSNHEIKVVYEIDKFAISTSVKGGTIDESCVADYGTSKTINYAAQEGYHLVSIAVDGSNVDIEQYASGYTFNNIKSDHEIKVVYEIDTFSISTSVENGTIDKSTTVDYGSTSTINYAPEEGYHLVTIIVDSSEVDITKHPSSYTFTDIKGEHDIKVIYEIDTFTIFTSVENGTIDEGCVADYGSSKTINYEAQEGYHLVSVTINSSNVDDSDADTSGDTDGSNSSDSDTKDSAADNSDADGNSDAAGSSDADEAASSDTTKDSATSDFAIKESSVDVEKYPSSYTFDDIKSDHEIKVTYEKDEQPSDNNKSTTSTGNNDDSASSTNGSNDSGASNGNNATTTKVSDSKSSGSSSSGSSSSSNPKTADNGRLYIVLVLFILAGSISYGCCRRYVRGRK